MGVAITLIIYTIGCCVSFVISYLYFMRVHRNGTYEYEQAPPQHQPQHHLSASCALLCASLALPTNHLHAAAHGAEQGTPVDSAVTCDRRL